MVEIKNWLYFDPRLKAQKLLIEKVNKFTKQKSEKIMKKLQVIKKILAIWLGVKLGDVFLSAGRKRHDFNGFQPFGWERSWAKFYFQSFGGGGRKRSKNFEKTRPSVNLNFVKLLLVYVSFTFVLLFSFSCMIYILFLSKLALILFAGLTRSYY